MAQPRDISGEKALKAVIDWWREAGVDYTYSDDASAFLAEPNAEGGDLADGAEPPPPKSRKSPAEPIVTGPVLPAPELWPATLAEFSDWWLSQPALGEGSGGRITPRGPAGAPLMVLVSQPEREDRDTLLSGPDGQLLDAFLRAAGLAEDAVYRASIASQYDPARDWTGCSHLAAAAWRHIALVDPKRLIVFGNNARSILQHDPTQRDYGLLGLNQEGLEVPVLAGSGLAAMRKAPRTKARLWRDWLEWTGK